jgi:hypothetical protein
MADFIDLIRMGRDDPKYLKSVLEDKEKLAGFQLTSAELGVLKKLDPDAIRTIMDNLEKKLRLRQIASTQACTGGTNACNERTTSPIPEISAGK